MPRRLFSKLIVGLFLASLSFTTTGCSFCRSKSEVANQLAEYWGWRASEARYEEAREAYEEEEKARARVCCDDCCPPQAQGTLQELVKTDLTITLEKGMEIESIGLDYDELVKQKAMQEKLDDDYEKAKKAYDDLMLDQNRKRLARSVGEANSKANGADGCAPPPDCALPPVEEALAPPPKRMALGMENVPLVIRARYSMSPRHTSLSKTEIDRRFLPGKQPCCPNQCVETGNCTDSCCPVPSTNYSAPNGNREPHTAPATYLDIFEEKKPSAQNTQPKNETNGQPITMGEPVFREPAFEQLLSFGE